MSEFKTCNMVGMGYIGLPTAAIMAASGIRVIGVDIQQSTVDSVNAGECPIEEPGLPALIANVVKDGRLTAGTIPQPADAFVIAVPTPFRGAYKPDLTYVEIAIRSIAPILKPGDLVLIESTIPVGATEQATEWLRELRPDLSFPRRVGKGAPPEVYVAHSPERILPGQMLRELVENDRVLGGVDKASAERARDFYKIFVKGACITTDARTAELCKLTENAFRDVNIAFANELATISKQVGVNVWELIRMANHHPRVNILQPGPGVGGHCIAVDPWFIVSTVGEKARLIREARWINSERPRQVVEEVLSVVKKTVACSIGCFGLSYKPNVDDLRESPAVEITQYLSLEANLISRDLTITVVEPHIKELPAGLAACNNVKLGSVAQGLSADVVVMLVDHTEFKQLPSNYLEGRTIVDTRGCWS